MQTSENKVVVQKKYNSMNLLQRISKWIFSRGTMPYWCILG